MGTLHYLNKKRFERMLGFSAVMVYAEKRQIGNLPSHVGATFSTHVPLRLGHQLSPPTPMSWDDETLTVEVKAGGQPYELEIPWAAVHRIDPVLPPGGGGGGQRRAA